ncbi:hypothetical protein [Methylotenera sp. N17]|uniref:hypothetical protein n=1 Tax=Methylotenera sp. N17 TaxID=1502761 RepID=UPI00069010E5|nr:hypothetical protein [Methylotenera sp. N17]
MSQRLHIDFVETSAFSFKKISLLGLAMLLTAIGCTLYWVQQYQLQQRTLSTLVSASGMSPALRNKPVELPIETASEDEVLYARDIVTQLSTPWNPLLTSLEQVSTQDIALLSIAPNRKKQQVVLTGQAKNMAATLQYVQALAQLNTLAQVYLLKHQIDQSDPYKPVGFTIVAQWNVAQSKAAQGKN